LSRASSSLAVPDGYGLNILAVALVLGCQHQVLPVEVGCLLTQPVPDVRLLRERESSPEAEQ
jgi:hypothetical protein